MKNYYQVLGLEKNATPEEIKKAYKLYASKFHPDKQHEDKFFEERFKEIKEAYDILSDTGKRNTYDASFEPNNTPPKPNYNTTYKSDYYNTTTEDKNFKEGTG
ncbi:MAG: DnaJ domain-containing protein [Bacteroidales bacterium]|nr:DnaJ domain-containing protein [Bacteroidales bacterium]